MAAPRLTRRNALVAAAGWVAAPRGSSAEGATAEGGVHALYPAIADALLAPEPERMTALERALDAYPAAHAAFGPGLCDYLIDQSANLIPEDARWARLADAADVAGQARAGLSRARTLLQSEQNPPVFLIYSHRFDGRSDGRAIFLGVDRFGEERLHRGVTLLTAHEYHHVVRAAHAPFASLLDAVVAEGLATACSELAEPGRPLYEYLLYPPEQLSWYTPARLEALWAAFGTAITCGGAQGRAVYLAGGGAGPDGAPARSGYYLGYLVARSWLARGVPIATLTKMPSAELWQGSGYAP